MPVSRYSNRGIKGLDKKLYKELLNKREIYDIIHYDTATYNYDIVDLVPFTLKEVVWKSGDRLYKLSQQYYGSVEYWWVIAFINQKPTDSHFQVGDILFIPQPLEEVLDFIGVY